MARKKNKVIPLLPLRGLLVFPTTVLHLDVGREKSVQALEKAMVEENLVLLTSQKDVQIDDPELEDVYEMGTIARVKQLLKLPNGTFRVLVEGVSRGKVVKWVSEEPCYVVQVEPFVDNEKEDIEFEALRRTMLEYFEQYIKLSKKLSADIYTSVMDIQQAGRMADIIASHLPLKLEEKQRLLEAVDVKERVHQIIQILHNEKEILHLEKRISQRVKQSMERTQKEYYLREQMKAIQKELGEKEGKAGEIDLLREKIEQAGMPEHVKATALKELERYEKVPA
ncbi:MAG: LON peptidase substrate-binding domain-containing protein, partial [Anoxybacillus ayderensis]|nr:LON peptidase substrate-binding domain-containing protein [Anoxybacillus ayderensis]